MDKELNIVNRKARHEYFIDESFTAGMSLTGSEVKSLRLGNVNMSEAYCIIDNGELVLKNMHISEFKQGGQHYNHAPLRDRKLLLTKKELRKLETKSQEQGTTIIPLKIFNADTGFIKIEIGLARGKKMFDKREDIKKRDVEREIRRYVD
jgi:SsrA-binding protein